MGSYRYDVKEDENMKAFVAMVYREIKKMLNSKSRIIGAITMPVMWYLFFGMGWNAALGNSPFIKILFGGLDYLQYLAPGIVIMAAFMGGFTSGLSIIFDLQFGYLKELLVAPADRREIVLGRIVGGALNSTIQATLMLIVLVIALGYTKIINVIEVVGVAFIASMVASALATLLASSMRSPEGFHAIINLIMMPMMFMSGAFFPIKNLPEWLKAFAVVDPMTYPVQIARGIMYGVNELGVAAWIGLGVYLMISILLVMKKFQKTYIA